MTLKEAKKELNRNKHIVGKIVDDFEITHIIIVPSKGNHVVNIAERINAGYSYDDILSQHNDFILYVLYDLEYIRLGQPLLFDPLGVAIRKIQG